MAIRSLVDAARTRPFWLLAGSFAICGATTNGLIATHFIPAAHDHGMPITVAASLLAVVGVFDVCGTIASGWLTDRFDPRILLVVLLHRPRPVAARAAIAAGPAHQSEHLGVHPVLRAGLGGDRAAHGRAVPAVLRRTRTGRLRLGVRRAPSSGAAVAASGAGFIRDVNGTYDLAFYLGAGLCVFAAAMCAAIGRRRVGAAAAVTA